MFVLFKGGVEVTANGRYVCKLMDGSIVGEAALLNMDNRRTASVRSVQKCDVAIIFRSTFHSILEKYPWEKRKFQREMKAKLMELGKLIDVKDDINLQQQASQCDLLKKVPFFAQDESLHDFVSELAMNASTYWYRPGRVIIQEGDTHCDEMYVLLRGAVEVTACGEFLGRLENDLFGEVGLLDLLERRTANVTAATQCHCMMFRREMVIPVLAKYPDARMKLLEHARQRLVALNEAINQHTDNNVHSRGLGDPSGPGSASIRLEGCAVGFGNSIPAGDAHLFAASQLFQDCRVDLLQELSAHFDTKRVDEGRTIFEEGDSFRADRDLVYFIANGQVEVWKSGHFIAVLSDGEVFGDIPALSNDKNGVRQASVVSKTKTVLRTITGTALHGILTSHEDEELNEMWAAQRQKREKQFQHKQNLHAHSLQKRTDPLDVMFMKLPVVREMPGEEKVRVPRIEGLQGALMDSCREASAWREATAGKSTARPGKLPALGFGPTLTIMPPASAR